MIEKGKLFFVVGIPRAGKTTWCDFWVRNVEANLERSVNSTQIMRPRAVIAGDDFRLALHGQAYEPLAEGTVFAMMDVAARALLARGFDVVMDETATTEETIKRYLRIDPEATPIFFDTPVEECVRRARETERSYLIVPIITRHAPQLAKLRANWDSTFARLKAEVLTKTSTN